MYRFGRRLIVAVVVLAVTLAAWLFRPQPGALGPTAQIRPTAGSEGSDLPPLSREAEAGRLLFERYCGSCHGRQGDGFGINAPNLPLEVPSLATATRVSAWSDPQLFARIARGGSTSERPPVCPAWGRRLTGREIDALVAFLRVLSHEKP
jgi:mono/diheme cytochrome c family protein